VARRPEEASILFFACCAGGKCGEDLHHGLGTPPVFRSFQSVFSVVLCLLVRPPPFGVLTSSMYAAQAASG